VKSERRTNKRSPTCFFAFVFLLSEWFGSFIVTYRTSGIEKSCIALKILLSNVQVRFFIRKTEKDEKSFRRRYGPSASAVAAVAVLAAPATALAATVSIVCTELEGRQGVVEGDRREGKVWNFGLKRDGKVREEFSETTARTKNVK